MQALRCYGKEDIMLVDVPVPEIGPGEILLRVAVAGVGDADIGVWKNGAGTSDAVTLGREFAGTVEETGEGVSTLQKGARVAVIPEIGCGTCAACAAGETHRCGSAKAFGRELDGGMAEYVCIPAGAVAGGNVVVLPEGMPFACGVLLDPLSRAYHGVQKCAVEPGDRVLVMGAGAMAVFSAAYLQMMGADVALCDKSFDRLAGIQRMLEDVGICDKGGIPEFVGKRGRGLRAVVVTGNEPEVQDVLPFMEHGGRVSFLTDMPLMPDGGLARKSELTLMGVGIPPRAVYRKALELMQDKRMPIPRVLTGEYRIGEAAQALEEAYAGGSLKSVVVF